MHRWQHARKEERLHYNWRVLNLATWLWLGLWPDPLWGPLKPCLTFETAEGCAWLVALAIPFGGSLLQTRPQTQNIFYPLEKSYFLFVHEYGWCYFLCIKNRCQHCFLISSLYTLIIHLVIYGNMPVQSTSTNCYSKANQHICLFDCFVSYNNSSLAVWRSCVHIVDFDKVDARSVLLSLVLTGARFTHVSSAILVWLHFSNPYIWAASAPSSLAL